MKRYMRVPFEVEAEKYEPGKGLEDGCKPLSEVITQDFVSMDMLVQITSENGTIVCPFVKSRRGITYIREGDFIIREASGDKHCCGSDKFDSRYKEVEE